MVRAVEDETPLARDFRVVMNVRTGKWESQRYTREVAKSKRVENHAQAEHY